MTSIAPTNSNENAQKNAVAKKALGQQASAEQNITYGGLIEEYHDPFVARFAIKAGAIAVVGFLVWSANAPVHELAIGQGAILPTGFVQKLQHLEGGNVEEILVQEGQTVLAGDPLVQLDNLSVRGELSKAEARLEFLGLAIQREKQTALGGLRLLTPGGAARFNTLLESQQFASEADDKYRQAQLRVAQASIEKKSAELGTLKNRVVSITHEFELASARFTKYNQAVQAGAISRSESDTVLREKLRLQSERAALQGQLQISQAGVIEARAQVDELDARFMQEAVEKIADLEVQKTEARELVSQLQDRLSRMTIRAPVNGTVNVLSVRNVGQVVRPGDVVVELVPIGGSVFAEVNIPTDQIGYVKVGMQANVKVLTFHFARFGAITGKVTEVSPTSILGEDGNFSYRVRLSLSDSYVGLHTDGRLVTPGMAVTADIKLGEKSVLSYLLKPLRAISDRAFSEQ